MSGRRLGIRLAAVVAALGVTVCWADDLAKIEKEIVEKSKAIRSAKFKFKTVMDMRMEGFENTGTGEGWTEYVVRDGKWFSRSESKDSTTTKMGDHETKTESTTLAISDGEFMYTLTDQNGQKMATKSRAQSPDAELNPFAMLRESHELKRLPDEKLDGDDCYVIEATPKGDSGMVGGGRMVQHFRKADGFAIRSVSYGPDDKPMITMTVTDIQVDIDIDPLRFKFEVPAGVEVMDMTGRTDEP